MMIWSGSLLADFGKSFDMVLWVRGPSAEIRLCRLDGPPRADPGAPEIGMAA